MTKLLVFDVDGTLAQLNENIKRENVLVLRELIDKGISVMLISGKPTAYLAGLSRQIGRKNIIISGENGMDIHYDIEFPSSKFKQFDITLKQKEVLNEIKEELSKMGNYFFQPNRVSVTPFFLDKKSKEKLNEYAEVIKSTYDIIGVYFHSDCVDFTPKGVSKGNAVMSVVNELKLDMDEFITIGDGENDIPMFEVSKNVIIVGNKVTHKGAKVFNETEEALQYIKEIS